MDMTRREFVGLAAGAAAGLSLPHVAWAAKGGARWYRGMIHAHTCWSDGRALPEQAVAAYKNGGYDFFSITDHNRIGSDPDRWIEVAPLTGGWPPKTIEPSMFEAFKAAFPDAQWRERDGKVEVRMSTMSEIAARFNEPGKFLFIPGCEVTTAISDANNVRRDLHMNYVGLDGLIPRASKTGLIEWVRGKTLSEVLRETKDEVDALAEKKGNPPHVFFANHPHWRYCDVLPEDLIANPDVRFMEICNTGSDWPPEQGMVQDGFYNDRVWDVVNAVRCRRGEPLLYGIATEDSHWYPGSGTSYKPAPVGSLEDSVSAIIRGSNTGSETTVTATSGNIDVKSSDVLNTLVFSGTMGKKSVRVGTSAAALTADQLAAVKFKTASGKLRAMTVDDEGYLVPPAAGMSVYLR